MITFMLVFLYIRCQVLTLGDTCVICNSYLLLYEENTI